MISEKLIEQLKSDEGFRKMPYYCTEGRLTVGYGYNMESNELNLTASQLAEIKRAGVSKTLASQMLLESLALLEKRVQDELPWLSKLTQTRRDVLFNMAYQLGVKGLLKFKRTLAAAQRGDYATCAAYMLESLWAKQTPNRVKRLSEQMRTGAYK